LGASNKQSKAALDATIAQSKASLDTTIKNAQDEERAWLTAAGFKLSEEPTLNKGFTVTVTVINTGRTPALDLTDQAVLASWPGQPPRVSFVLPPNPVSKAILAPGPTNMSFTSAPLILTTDIQMSAYTAKANHIYVQALVRYTDAFKRLHWTRICADHISGTPLDVFQYCTEGNEIDQEGQTNPN
jgi:hypothetical protein